MKAQVSFEYMLLITMVLFVFITILSVYSFLFDRADSPRDAAGEVVNDVKYKAITASLSESDITLGVRLPPTVADKKFDVRIYKDPDNLIIITGEDEVDKAVFAKGFLPIIDELWYYNPDTGVVTRPSPETAPLDITASTFDIEKHGNVLRACVPRCPP